MSRSLLKQWQATLFQSNSLALLCVFGMLTGLATSLVIAAFMLAIDFIQFLLQGSNGIGFSGLIPIWRFLLPVIGAVILVILYKITNTRYHDVGIAHVIDRLQRGRGKIPIGNSFFQLATALVSVGSGFSLGKEGPAVHIGSGIASKMGRQFNRSPSQVRILTGCGTAAAISAAFGTPLAGVLFAMEVVLMEYSLSGFIPIIAASVTAAVSTSYLLGEHPAFIQIAVAPLETFDAPWLLVTGIATGVVAALLHKLIKQFLTLNIVSKSRKIILAGLITGGIGFFVPQVMGLGYDTMNDIASGQFTWWLLLVILIAKMFATAAAVGLGIPAGIVAPSLVIGMATGALVSFLAPGGEANSGFYALVGMAGLMSALLHAPLAALTAVLELSLNAQMMFPAMIVVVLANLTCQVLFLQPSIFQTLLSNRGLHINTHPMRNALASRFLTEIATEQFSVITHDMTEDNLELLMGSNHRLIVIRGLSDSYLITKNMLSNQFKLWHSSKFKDDRTLHTLLETTIPERSRITILKEDVSLLEAIKILQSDDVLGIQVPLDEFRVGLVTRSKLTSVLTTEGEMD